MSEKDEAEEFANRVIDTMGGAETLLMAMRLVLLVCQRVAPDDPVVVAAAKQAVAGIQRVGAVTGVFQAG